MFVATIFRIFGAFTSKNHFKKSISKPYQVRWSICPRSLKIIQDSLKSDLCPNCKFRSRRSSLSTVDFTHKKTILVHLWIPHLIAPCLNALNIYCQMQGCLKEKRLFLTSLKQTCNEYLIKFSGNQSAPKLENRKTSPCSPCAPNLLHGYRNLCSPVSKYRCFKD